MATLDDLTTNSASFGSPINLTYATANVSFNKPASGNMLLIVDVDQYEFTSGTTTETFIRFRFFKLETTYQVLPGHYYWSQVVPSSAGQNACLGFYNAMTNHVDQWLFDVWGNYDPSTILINPRFGDYLPIVPNFYEDEDEDEPIEP